MPSDPTVTPAPAPTPAAIPAAASAAAPAVAASAGGVVDATGLRTLWPEVLDVVKQSNRTTRALLDNAQVAGLSGDVVTLSATSAPLARMLGEDRNTTVLGAALTSVLGGKWRITVELGGGPTADTTSSPSSAAPTPGPNGAGGAGSSTNGASAPAADAGSTPVAASASRPERSPGPAASPARRSDDPRDDTEPDDPNDPAPRADPETDALRLLHDTLGARPLDA
jgi:DNA polymerase-3 subunit gamma/tau